MGDYPNPGRLVSFFSVSMSYFFDWLGRWFFTNEREKKKLQRILSLVGTRIIGLSINIVLSYGDVLLQYDMCLIPVQKS